MDGVRSVRSRVRLPSVFYDDKDQALDALIRDHPEDAQLGVCGEHRAKWAAKADIVGYAPVHQVQPGAIRREPRSISVPLTMRNGRCSFEESSRYVRPAKDVAVVIVGSEIDSVVARREELDPRQGIERCSHEIALYVEVEEVAFEVRHREATIKGVGHTGEATAGDAGDDVDLIEQRAATADLGSVKVRERPVCQRRSAGSSTAEGKDDECLISSWIVRKILEAITVLRIQATERSIALVVRTRGEKEEKDHAEPLHAFFSKVTCGSMGVVPLISGRRHCGV